MQLRNIHAPSRRVCVSGCRGQTKLAFHGPVRCINDPSHPSAAVWPLSKKRKQRTAPSALQGAVPAHRHSAAPYSAAEMAEMRSFVSHANEAVPIHPTVCNSNSLAWTLTKCRSQAGSRPSRGARMKVVYGVLHSTLATMVGIGRTTG